MFLSCRSIPLDSISFSTDWNLHPWDFRSISEELQENFTENGIIHPPIVIAKSDKTYTLVAGARRVEFLKNSIGLSSIDCMLIADDAPDSFILKLILADQNCAAKLSLAEKARFVEISSKFLDKEEIVTTFQTKLRLKNGPAAIPDLLKILQQDTSIIKAIHAGQIQDKMVSDILSLPEEGDRWALVQLFIALGMGDGKQKRFFTLLRDLAYREGSPIASYIKKKEIEEILNHRVMNIPQKIQHLGNLLQHELTPRSMEAESSFEKQVKELQLPAHSAISHAPYFEKDEVTLSITFKDLAVCKQYLEKVFTGSSGDLK